MVYDVAPVVIQVTTAEVVDGVTDGAPGALHVEVEQDPVVEKLSVEDQELITPEHAPCTLNS